MSESVRCTVEADGVGRVRLNRPEKLNALDGWCFQALAEAGEALSERKDLRVVLIEGEGAGFCAGVDVGRMLDFSSTGADGRPAVDLRTRTHGAANLAQRAVLTWRELPVPVIAAVHGVAFGAGLQLAMAADLRLVGEAARLSVMELRLGLVPDMGGFVLMHELLRPDIARDLTFTGRIVDGAEAVSLGLATRMCADPRAEALELARRIAGSSPSAIRAAKRLFRLAGTAEAEVCLLAESMEQQALMAGSDFGELVRARLEDRVPRFETAKL